MQGSVNKLTGRTRHTFHFEHHIGEDVLELYALDRIHDEERLAPIEEHLLVCHSCQDRLRQEDALALRIKAALERDWHSPERTAQ
jgi:hypothetical protein